jgi:parallel beta-helix repeat protein
MKKIVLSAFVLGLLSTAICVGFVRPTVAEWAIYIRSDGSVDPATAPIQRNGNIYTLTENIYDEIVVERDNIVVDGAGYLLQGTGSVRGIDLSHRSNVTIKNMQIGGRFGCGIYLQNSSNNTITENNIANNMDGICLQLSSNNRISANYLIDNLRFGIMIQDSSNNNIISENNVIDNGGGISIYSSSNNRLINNNMKNDYNFEVYGTELSHFVNDVDSSNTINDKKVYYFVNESDLIISSFTFPDLGFLALVNCTRIIVQNLNLANNGQGILLAFTTNSTITKNHITHNSYGIGFYSSSKNIISGNHITNNLRCIHLFESSSNTIYNNNFINNTKQVDDLAFGSNSARLSVNVWDDGYPSGGNYWDDYLTQYPNAKEIDGSGIGDTPYVIYERNQDDYPLLPYWFPPTISVVSPENKTYIIGNVSLTFTLSEPVSWIGYSLDGQANVTITGDTDLTGLSDGSHSLIVYAEDTAGNTGTSETIYFSIAQKKETPAHMILFREALIVGFTIAIAVIIMIIRKEIQRKNTNGKKRANKLHLAHACRILATVSSFWKKHWS